MSPIRQKAICSWCGAPSGQQGITLRKVALADKHGQIDETLLCPMCFNEYRQFGRLGTFSEWFRFYRASIASEFRKVLRVLFALLSPRRHWVMIRRHYRFRARGMKVRA